MPEGGVHVQEVRRMEALVRSLPAPQAAQVVALWEAFIQVTTLPHHGGAAMYDADTQEKSR